MDGLARSDISPQGKLESVANKWARVATSADNMVDGEKKPDGPEEKDSDAIEEADPDLGNEEGCEEFVSGKLDHLAKTSWESFDVVSKQLEEDSKGELKAVVACEENFANPDEDAKPSEEEFLQVFGFVLQIFGF